LLKIGVNRHCGDAEVGNNRGIHRRMTKIDALNRLRQRL